MNAERHHRAMQLFQEALERSGGDREAFLKRTCAGDAETLAEVESLLRFHNSHTIVPTRTVALVPTARLADAVPSVLSHLSPRRWGALSPQRLRAALAALALAALLAALGYWLDNQVERRLKQNLADQLVATLDSNVAAVSNWLRLQEQEVQAWASHPKLREDFAQLVALAQSPDKSLDDLRGSEPHAAVLDLLKLLLDDPNVRAVNAINADGLMVLTSRDKLHERYRLTPEGIRLIAPVLLGQNIVAPPLRGHTLVENEAPDANDDPIIIVGSPIRDSNGRIIGGLFASIEADKEFTQLLDLASAGPGGDTYAFGPKGELLSASKYERQLSSIGAMPSGQPGTSVLNVEVRDPGVDLTSGARPAAPIAQRPLTRMAAAAIAGGADVDVAGYRDYRGVDVVGAWRWLPRYEFGVATEIEFDDAFSPLNYVRRTLWSLFGLLVIAAGVAFGSSVWATRMRREIGIARQLGQYTLEELIGEGGMGKVFKARHAMLRRPTAVKVLDGESAGPAAIARFEREVQLASSLTHPNTVEIFDFGRTADDVFYFAMEYLPGITLDGLVRRDGAIPAPRVLFILRQVLGSLTEAHARGLVHRDIKPANIILCNRGGLADFVKVVDFGLAREFTLGKDSQITLAGVISGTPLYIAPECLGDPQGASPQSDIYALGAVAFYLLTGRDLFVGANALEVLRKVGNNEPPRVSQFVPTVPTALDDLVFRCVARDPAARPSSATEMLVAIDTLLKDHPWTQADAAAWWKSYEQTEKSSESNASLTTQTQG